VSSAIQRLRINDAVLDEMDEELGAGIGFRGGGALSLWMARDPPAVEPSMDAALWDQFPQLGSEEGCYFTIFSYNQFIKRSIKEPFLMSGI
jgi:hypothetical protein